MRVLLLTLAYVFTVTVNVNEMRGNSVTNQGLPASHNGVVLISVDPPSVTNQGLPPSPKKYGYFMAFAQQAFTYQT